MIAKADIKVLQYNGTCGLTILCNDYKTVFQPNYFSGGDHTIEFKFEPGSVCSFYIFGKNQLNDSVMQNNVLIDDKAIIFNSIIFEYLKLDHNKMNAIDFNPYFGMNKQKKKIYIPPIDQWSYWYLDIEETIQ